MSNLLRHRPSASMVVACIALFVALGGVGYAAATIGSGQIKNNAIKSVDIKNRGIATKDLSRKAVAALRGRQGPQGLQGPAGPQGPTGAPGATSIVAREAVQQNVSAGQFGDAEVQCQAGEKVVGGGGGFTVNDTLNYGNLHTETDAGISSPVDAGGDAPGPNSSPTGWRFSAVNGSGTRDLHVYVLCAQP